MKESYLTIIDPVEVEMVEKRSKFLGHMIHVRSRLEAESFISAIRSEYKDATHNVPAYSVYKNGVMYCSDDGEPHGTSGKPILEVLKRERIYDVCVVVTRYFGGILLGTGGLVRAYSAAAALGVEEAIPVTVRLYIKGKMRFGYERYGPISAALAAEGAIIDDTSFTDSVEVSFRIAEEEFQNICNIIINITNGSIFPEKTGEDGDPAEERR